MLFVLIVHMNGGISTVHSRFRTTDFWETFHDHFILFSEILPGDSWEEFAERPIFTPVFVSQFGLQNKIRKKFSSAISSRQISGKNSGSK